MYRMLTICLISVIVFSAAAQTAGLSGKVTNKSGKAIKGAIVTLAVKKLKDTTDAEGTYMLSGVNIANPSPILPNAERISLKNGTVMFSLTKPAAVKIELFSMSGKLVEKVNDQPASPGNYRFDIMKHSRAANMMVVRVAIGQWTSTLRYLPPTDGRCTTASSKTVCSARRKLAELKTIIDTLQVTAPNYEPRDTMISSYESVVDITLDSITLEKFSFFVTSMKGLLELSGSEKGFGGDLRFGKTGQGAGLLGADSICECLAEKSMPGSKAKQWRAFLSVSKGPDGTQVNAIDRIGKGPWYDRLGRLVANNVTDLLNDRPSSADTVIKNDLPNEYGIPNHRPDSTQPAHENYLTITGSGKDGKLYSDSSTCEDWTSAENNASRPRSGMSWPLTFTFEGAMPLANWISVWDMSGCAPGIDINAAIMAGSDMGTMNNYTLIGLPPSIGSGGGYGGFYCFALEP